MKITLFGWPYTRSDRVQWTLEELGVSYTYTKLDVFRLEHRAPEYKRKYGLTRLPFVQVDSDIIFESSAIMIFLAEQFRSRIDLLPSKPAIQRTAVLQWLSFANSTFESSDFELPAGSEPGPFVPLVDTLDFLEHELRDKTFIAADRFSIADIALANQFKWIDPQIVSRYANITSYFDGHTSRPAFRKIACQPEYPK